MGLEGLGPFLGFVFIFLIIPLLLLVHVIEGKKL